MPARFDSQYQEFGYFARTHGSDGELLLISEYAVASLMEKQPVIRYQNERGDLVPVRLKEVRSAETNRENAFFVKLVQIKDRHSAEPLKGKSIWTEKTVLDELEQKPNSVPYYQFEVIDREQQPVGTVVNGFKTPGQQILEIELTDGDLLMVPLVDEFIVEVDEENRQLTSQNLEILKDV